MNNNRVLRLLDANGRAPAVQPVTPRELRGGVLLGVDPRQEFAQATLELAKQIAASSDIGEALDFVSSKTDNPPTPYQQATLNLMTALVSCQFAIREAIKDASAALAAQNAAPETTEEETSNGT